MGLRVRSPAERRARDAARAPLRAAKEALAGRSAPPANDVAPAAAARPVEVRRSTTVRPPATAPQERRSDVRSETLLGWVRAQPCEVRAPGCVGGPRVDPHHWPTKGSLGLQIDALIVSACCACHRACHDGHVSIADQEAAAGRTWARFWRLAPPAVQRKVIAELAASLE